VAKVYSPRHPPNSTSQHAPPIAGLHCQCGRRSHHLHDANLTLPSIAWEISFLYSAGGGSSGSLNIAFLATDRPIIAKRDLI
jgi:hypothetical protein